MSEIKKESAVTQTQQVSSDTPNIVKLATKVNSCTGLEYDILNHMRSNGIEYQGPVVLDTKIHRFSSDSNKSKKDEWYVGNTWDYKGHVYATVTYGSWSNSDEKHAYKSWEDAGISLSDDALKFAKKRQADLEKQVERERIQGYETAAKEVLEIWRSGKEFPYLDGHDAYSKSKNIEPTNLRYGIYHDGTPAMFVPMYDINDELRSIQYIFQKNGKFHKRFHYRAP